MDANRFLQTAITPGEWLKKSSALRRSADCLWDQFHSATLRWLKSVDTSVGRGDDILWEEASAHLNSSKLLYGLSLETTFKAAILQTRPTDIEFKMSADGTGAITAVEVKHFGVSLGQGHNLELLAEKAGAFDSKCGVFSVESDQRALREVLRHLTEVVYWSGRYPIPLRSGPTHQLAPDVPARVLGHYIRDWIDPVFDHYFSSMKPQPPNDESGG